MDSSVEIKTAPQHSVGAYNEEALAVNFYAAALMRQTTALIWIAPKGEERSKREFANTNN